MKKRILMIIALLIMVFPSIALAEGYNQLNIRAIFVTSADTDVVNKVYVQFKTYSGSVVEKKDVTLLRNEGFQKTLDFAYPIEDVSFVYGYTISIDDKVDKFGFLPITASRSVKGEGVLELVLSIDFDNLGFDGKKYRSNSDITDDEINDIVNGRAISIANDDHYNTSPDQLDDQATAPPVDDNLNLIEETTTLVVQDPDNKKDDKKKDTVEDSKSYKLLIIMAAIIFGFIALAIIVLVVKNNQANKRL